MIQEVIPLVRRLENIHQVGQGRLVPIFVRRAELELGMLVGKALAEEAKVSIRNVRRDALDLLKIDETMSDDYKKRVEDEIQKVVTESNKSVEDILAEKTKEILSI